MGREEKEEDIVNAALETAHDIRQRHQREVCALGRENSWVLVAFESGAAIFRRDNITAPLLKEDDTETWANTPISFFQENRGREYHVSSVLFEEEETESKSTSSTLFSNVSALRNRTLAKSLVSSRFLLTFEEACQEWLSRVEGLAGWYGRIAGIRETAVVPRPRPGQLQERDEEDVRLDKITAEIRQLLEEEKY